MFTIVLSGGLLRDGMLGRQSAAGLREVLSPKLAGTLAINEASHGIPLAACSLFSSIASLLGNPGQANYSAANGILDAFADKQQAQVPHLTMEYLNSVNGIYFLFRFATSQFHSPKHQLCG